MNFAQGSPERGNYELFPPLEHFVDGWLPVDGGHSLYWSESGNPDGIPVIFVHGGPGAGCSPAHRRFFDPGVWRIVMVDQRGSGRSVPIAATEDNDLAALVSDLERLREYRGIERWLVFGGSWGCTLGLAYGIAHPARCFGFVLRGVFLGTPSEIDWFLHGMGQFFPEAEEHFLAQVPADEKHDVLGSYISMLTDPSPDIHMPAAKAWTEYESRCSSIQPVLHDPRVTSNRFALAVARLEAHYFANQCFLAPNELLDGVSALHHLPCIIIQGRYDVVCPPRTASALHKRWPGSVLSIVADAGHSAMEAGTRAGLVWATETMAKIYTREPGLAELA